MELPLPLCLDHHHDGNAHDDDHHDQDEVLFITARTFCLSFSSIAMFAKGLDGRRDEREGISHKFKFSWFWPSLAKPGTHKLTEAFYIMFFSGSSPDWNWSDTYQSPPNNFKAQRNESSMKLVKCFSTLLSPGILKASNISEMCFKFSAQLRQLWGMENERKSFVCFPNFIFLISNFHNLSFKDFFP